MLITISTPIIERGIVMIGIVTALSDPIKNVITINTIIAASIIVTITSCIESSIAIVLSYIGIIFIAVGSFSLTAFAISKGLAVGVASIPTRMACVPFAKAL